MFAIMTVFNRKILKTLIKIKNKSGRDSLRTVFINHQTDVKSFDCMPGPLSLPLIGTLYNYCPLIGSNKFDRLHINGSKNLKRYGPIIREEIVPGVNVVWLFKPEDIETLFRFEGKCPLRRSHLALEKYRLDRPHIYNTGGLLPTNGAEWMRLRGVFQKGLSSPAAVQIFLNSCDDIVAEWLQRVDRLTLETNVDYLPELSRLFLELTGVATLDVRFNSFSDLELKENSRSSRLIKSAVDTNSSILKTDNGPQLWRKFETPLYRKLRQAQEFMESVALDVLSSKMNLFEEKGDTNLSSLLKTYSNSSDLDIKDIIGVICDFLLAGVDTSTFTTSFLLYHLAKNPVTQQTLYEESCRLLPSYNTPVTSPILAEAQYAKAVLKESLRLKPISIGVGRILPTDVVFSGYNVPAGTVVVTQNQVACAQDKYFPDAKQFKPERWLRNHPGYQRPHPFLLLPFGHGPRSCIARRFSEQNLLVLMLKLIRSYQIEWMGGELDSKSLLINKPDGPILLKFKNRS